MFYVNQHQRNQQQTRDTPHNPTSLQQYPRHTELHTIHTDKIGKVGGGLFIYNTQNKTFTHLNIPIKFRTHNTKPQMVRIHTNKYITCFHLYIPLRDAATHHYVTLDT